MKNIPQAYRPSYLWFWPPLILGGSVISAGTIHDLRRVKVPGTGPLWNPWIVAVSFIGGGNWSTLIKPPTCHKSLTNFITWYKYMYIHFFGQNVLPFHIKLPSNKTITGKNISHPISWQTYILLSNSKLSILIFRRINLQFDGNFLIKIMNCYNYITC